MQTAFAPVYEEEHVRPAPGPRLLLQTPRQPARRPRRARGLRRPAVRLALVCLGIGIILGLLAPKILASGAQDGGDLRQIYVVAKGDTLWKLAREQAPDQDPREFIEKVRALNGVDVGNILPGQKLVLPSS